LARFDYFQTSVEIVEPDICKVVGVIAGFVKNMGTTTSGMLSQFQKSLKPTIRAVE